MSLVNWLSGTGPKPGLKRKLDDATDSDSESGPDKKKKPKEMAQKNFDWYKQDESGKWHCTICRLPNWTMLMQKVMTHQQKPPTIPDTVLVSMAFFVGVDLLWGGGGGEED